MPSIKSASLLRHTIGPLLLILICPPTAIIMWYINVVLNGSILQLWHLIQAQGFFSMIYHAWRPVMFGTPTAWGIITIFAIFQLILMRIVPGKTFEGPLTPKGNIPVYKDNGFSCYLISIISFLALSYGLHLFPASILYDNLGGILGALNIFSLFFCLFLYLKGRFKPSSSDHSLTGNIVFDYYWGTELYPRVWGWDIKVFTNCRFGMMAWPILLLSYAAKQAELFGLSDTMLISVLIQLVYISKFFWWETGYLCSLDIMHDRAGFYICWGCLVWVPAIYTSPTLYLVNHPNNIGIFWSALLLTAGITSVMINYFADRQRQIVRTTQGKCKVWGQKPTLLHTQYTTSSGETKQSILLTSGWWGVSRHFHYVPEILGAFFWTLPALFNHFIPYFYVIFLTILLVDRAYRDETRCRKKYGKYWDDYCQQVPDKIIPFQRIGKLLKRFLINELPSVN